MAYQTIQVILQVKGDDRQTAKDLTIHELVERLNQWFCRDLVAPFPDGSLLLWSIEGYSQDDHNPDHQQKERTDGSH